MENNRSIARKYVELLTCTQDYTRLIFILKIFTKNSRFMGFTHCYPIALIFAKKKLTILVTTLEIKHFKCRFHEQKRATHVFYQWTMRTAWYVDSNFLIFVSLFSLSAWRALKRTMQMLGNVMMKNGSWKEWKPSTNILINGRKLHQGSLIVAENIL